MFPDHNPENTRKHRLVFPDPAPCVRRRDNQPSRLCKHLTSPRYRGARRCSNWGTLRKHIGGCGYRVLFRLSHAPPFVCGSRMPKPARLWAPQEAAVNAAGRTHVPEPSNPSSGRTQLALGAETRFPERDSGASVAACKHSHRACHREGPRWHPGAQGMGFQGPGCSVGPGDSSKLALVTPLAFVDEERVWKTPRVCERLLNKPQGCERGSPPITNKTK